jgi:hypothetical protein
VTGAEERGDQGRGVDEDSRRRSMNLLSPWTCDFIFIPNKSNAVTVIATRVEIKKGRFLNPALVRTVSFLKVSFNPQSILM